MIQELFTKENIALVGVFSLFLWRIMDFFIRQAKKRESEVGKLAFEMAKLHSDQGDREFLLSYYLYYLDALEINKRPYTRSAFNRMKHLNEQLTQKIDRMNHALEQLNAIQEKLRNSQGVSAADLWDRHVNWSIWWHETKTLLAKTLSRKRKFRSLT